MEPTSPRDREPRTESGDALSLLTTWAELLVPTCTHVGLLLASSAGRPHTSAPSTRRGQPADLWQLTQNEGPSVDVLTGSQYVGSGDLAAEPRWPDWSRRVVQELSIHSVAAIRLTSPGPDEQAVLTLYSDRRRAFTRHQVEKVASLGLVASTELPTRIAARRRQLSLLDDPVVATAAGVVMIRERLNLLEAVVRLEREAREAGLSVHERAEALIRGHHT